ncbi:MAG: two-component regulator propeller domain-containing protein [Xanthomarina sp.]
MNKRILLIIVLFFPIVIIAQDYSSHWKGYFSFLNIKDVSQGNGKIFVAAENAVFSYDVHTHEIETLTSINGLSGEEISAIYYSDAYQMLLIGYSNGLIEIALDNETNILHIVDILDKPTIPPTSKKINYFEEYNQFIYISTDYGISVYDMSRLEFGDTYYIGSNGSQVRVMQTTISDGYIYAACHSGIGFKRALVASLNLIDYQAWNSVVTSGNFIGVQATEEGHVYVIRNDRNVFKVNNTTLQLMTTIPAPILDYRIKENKLLVTTKDFSYVFNSDFVQNLAVPVPQSFTTKFTVSILNNGFIYMGTEDFGLLKTQYLNPVEFIEVHPDGPLRNNPFAIQATPDNLWVTYGDYSLTYNPSPSRKWGFSHLVEDSWVNVPYDSVLGAMDLNKIAVNPFNNQQVFISSFSNGLLEVNNNVPTVLYNETNSSLASLIVPGSPNVKSIRVSASAFDRSGVLWTMTGRVAKPLVSYDPNSGQWQSYDFMSLFTDPLEGEWGYSAIKIDDSGTKWIGGYNHGLIGYNNSNGVKLRGLYTENQNMPSSFVSAIAIDKKNQIWIGTIKGLRVLYNINGFFTDPSIKAQSIIIMDDGVPKELLYQTFISEIEVDGSNNKWVGTYGSGLFYFSADGQKTIYHFTKNNSPLPSNNIVDIKIDQANGVIYIATEKGLVSYNSGSSQTQTTLENAFINPNPVRPNYNMSDKKIKIKGITDNMNIKITDIEGNLVAEAQSNTNTRYKGYHLEIDGGTAHWNGKNLANNTVASGVYLIMLSDLDSFETKVIKLMVVR